MGSSLKQNVPFGKKCLVWKRNVSFGAVMSPLLHKSLISSVTLPLQRSMVENEDFVTCLSET